MSRFCFAFLFLFGAVRSKLRKYTYWSAYSLLRNTCGGHFCLLIVFSNSLKKVNRAKELGGRRLRWCYTRLCTVCFLLCQIRRFSDIAQ